MKMDQFSHDLTLALEETSLLDKARVSRWGQRRRTRSTGNLPCAPQPTEDSSSSPTDAHTSKANTNIDGLNISNVELLASDSDEALRLPHKSINCTMRLGTLESDSVNEAFSPARFFKPSARRKRKLKRMAVDYDMSSSVITQNDYIESSSLINKSGTTSLVTCTGTIRKRVLKPETARSTMLFCGKRKRSNRDRYHEHDPKAHSFSMPKHTYLEEYRIRPRSYSSTSKPHSDRLLPLNKGLLSKIEKISQIQKTDLEALNNIAHMNTSKQLISNISEESTKSWAKSQKLLQVSEQKFNSNFHEHHRKKHNRLQNTQLQFDVNSPMNCNERNDFLSSSSLSSSDTDDIHTINDTDHEGDDELTDWPGNECGNASLDNKYDLKRKLTKKSNLTQIKSDDGMLIEDDTLISRSSEWGSIDIHDNFEMRYQPSDPITITNQNLGRSSIFSDSHTNEDLSIPLKQIESEMSGETSNPFLSSYPCPPTEVREIRAGCRRIKGERPAFSIKASVNERLARFLQDPKQVQIRLPDIEIYEHESLVNLATLYSLKITLDKGCAVLTKTSNTTQSVSIDQQNLQNRFFLSDFKRRCCEHKISFVPQQ